MTPEIIVTHVAGSTLAGREQRFNSSRILVGRHPECNLAFDSHRDLSVSGQHAEIFAQGDELYVKDLRSRNGTYINNQRLHDATRLTPTDVVSFGFDGPQIRAELAVTEMVTSSGGEDSNMRQDVSKTKLQEMLAVFLKRQRSPGTRWLPMIFCVVCAFGIGLAVQYWIINRQTLSQPTTSTPIPEETTPFAANAVSALGRLEPDGGVVRVGAPVGERIDVVHVEEGDSVSKGDPLVDLSSRDVLLAEVERAKAAKEDAVTNRNLAVEYGDALIEKANTAVAHLERNKKIEKSKLDARIAVLEERLRIVISDTERLRDKKDQVPEEQIARQQRVEDSTRLELTAARKDLSHLDEKYELAFEQASVDLSAARKEAARLRGSIGVDVPEKSLELANRRYEQSQITAPSDGVILKVNAREGGAVGQQPIVEMADTRRFFVRAEVYESDVQYVKVDQSARIESSALPEPLVGTVDRILYTVSAEVLRSLDPTAPADLRVVNVKIRIDDDQAAKYRELLTRLIHLQVNVQINVDDQDEP